ncbi:MAG TPA: DUF262 domain-containing HNH endonuclease family protein [Candidatus Acidoferrum sp.]|nr:DUF262 domain-containing HNH endonuclease family protein [Candidatus Acidoferrum sp.]
MQTGLSFEAKDKTLQDVLFAGRRFQVPRFQRPYAWQTREVSEFWDDLVGAEEPYFLGSFILNSEHEMETGYVDIIDGQQRLLTITILCAVLRDCARKLSREKAGLFQRQDISIEGRDGIQSFRIKPAETIAEFFQQNIQQDKSNILDSTTHSPEEKRVRDNYLFLKDKIEKQLETRNSRDSKLELLDGLRVMVAGLIVINIEIRREEDAYEIFETTNARGLELSVADLLKNLIFQRIPAGQHQDLAKDTWAEITGDIESTNTELRKFIRYFWISKYSFLSEKKLFRAIKDRIVDWQQLLEDLAENSKLYSRMLAGTEQDFQELKHGSKIYDSLFALRLMGVTQCYVLLLSILRNFEHLGTDPTRIIQFIEKFSFKYSVICKQPTNRVEKVFSSTAIKIDKAVSEGPSKHLSGEIQAIFAELEKNLRELIPSEQVFLESFEDLAYRNTDESRRLIKYVLGKMNAHFSKTDEHKIDFNVVNIEHILPQKPHKDWKLKRSEIKSYVNMLGNLTLVSRRINSKVQNAILSEKLPELEKSELAITKELVKVIKRLDGQWGEAEIEKRHKELAVLAYRQIWA